MAKSGWHNAAKTHCPRGHPYSLENTYIQHGGGRRCRTCMKDQGKAARSAPGARERANAWEATYRLRHPDRVHASVKRWADAHPEAKRLHSARMYLARHLRLAQFKDKPCVDCGGRFPPECMDFDHVRGQKTKNIAAIATGSLERLLDEIAKCDLVCANCHGTRTRKKSDSQLRKVGQGWTPRSYRSSHS
jgi:hypothetical protein